MTKPRDFWDPAVSTNFTSFVDSVIDRDDYEEVKDLMFDYKHDFSFAANAAKENYPTGEDPTPFLPMPQSLKSIAKLPPKVRDARNEAYGCEIKNLFHMKTFAIPTDYNGEHCLPIRAVLKTKLRSDGMVNKLKVRITV